LKNFFVIFLQIEQYFIEFLFNLNIFFFNYFKFFYIFSLLEEYLLMSSLMLFFYLWIFDNNLTIHSSRFLFYSHNGIILRDFSNHFYKIIVWALLGGALVKNKETKIAIKKINFLKFFFITIKFKNELNFHIILLLIY